MPLKAIVSFFKKVAANQQVRKVATEAVSAAAGAVATVVVEALRKKK
jgi:hypothetical protein